MKCTSTSRRARPARSRVAAAAILAGGALAVGLSGVAAAAPPHTAAAASTTSTLDPSQFRGVNWADARDNFVDGPVIPSGLSTADDYATTYDKSRQILKQFQAVTRANTVRLPVNAASVGSAWWTSYKAAVDAATGLNMKVVLSYWEANSSRDGMVDDVTAWNNMWATLTSTYTSNPHVYFEPMNEPHGYSDADLRALEADWIAKHPSVPRNRIFISGTGYNDHTSTQCADPALAGTYVTQHFYGFWHQGPTYAEWRDNLLGRVAGCEGRLVVDEFGAPMTSGYDYTASATGTNDAKRNEHVAYMQATADVIREMNAGAIYWPGLRNGDSYSLTTLDPRNKKLTLSLNSSSGLALIHYAWGKGRHAPYPAS